MEYAPDGDLAKVIKKHQVLHRPMPEDLAWKYFIQVSGMFIPLIVFYLVVGIGQLKSCALKPISIADLGASLWVSCTKSDALRPNLLT